MVSSTSRQSSHNSPHNLEPCISEAIRQGMLKRRDHLRLTAALLSSHLSADERHQVNQVFDLVRAGRIRLVD